MSPVDLDRDSAALRDEITKRIKDPQGADPEIVANELILWALAHGWRPTEAGSARPGADWRMRPGGRPPSPEYLAARAEIEAKAATDA